MNLIKVNRIVWTLCLSLIYGIEYPNFEVIAHNNPSPQDIFINIRSNEGYDFLSIIDSNLNLKWSVVNSDSKGWDFKVNNNNQLTYFQKLANGEDRWYVMNEDMQEINTLYFANDYEADNHDIQYLENGGYILQAYGKEEVDIPQTAHIDTANILILQEFNSNHDLIFEWKNSDYMNIDDYIDSFNPNANYLNWTHGNSIEVDNDNNIIISNRAMSEAVKIDRLTGEVIWTLGGPANSFTFINDPYNGPLRQHDIRRTYNGNLMIFDNGSSTGQNSRPSRVTEYNIDESNMTATLVWEYFHPENYLAANQGSAQRLNNGNTIISWGTVSGHGAIITEVNYEKEIVLEIEYPQGNHTYRAQKKDWEFDINLIEGDINLDNFIDILDLITSVNIVLYNENYSIFELHKVDLNNDAVINILDLVDMINLII